MRHVFHVAPVPFCTSADVALEKDLPKQNPCAKESTTASYDVVPGRRHKETADGEDFKP